MDQVDQHLCPGGQIQNAIQLALRNQRLPNARIVPVALQCPFIFESKSSLAIPNPDVDDGVVVLLIGRAGNGIERRHFDLRLPVREHVLMGQSQPNLIQLKGMENLRTVRKMFRRRVQDSGEVAMMFDEGDACAADAIDSRLRAKRSLTDRQKAGSQQPTGSPAKTVARRLRSAEPQQLV